MHRLSETIPEKQNVQGLTWIEVKNVNRVGL